MALRNSFDSKVNRGFRTTNTILEIRKSHLINPTFSEGKDIIFVSDADQDVSPFMHPLYDPQADIVYVDMRGYSNLDRNGNFSLKNDFDSELQLTRAKLELCWQRAKANELFNSFSYSNEIYVRWMAETLTKNFSLNPAQDTQLRVLLALFSIGQYYNNVSDPALVMRYYRLISQTHFVDIGTVEEIANRLTVPFPRDLSEFVASIKEANISTRMVNINEVTLLNSLGGAWFYTANPTITVGLGLEYPPAFASLVALAVKYKLFKKTGIGGVVDRITRNNSHDNYVRALQYLIERNVGEPHPGKHLTWGNESYDDYCQLTTSYVSVGLESGGEILNLVKVILTAAAAGALGGLLFWGIATFIGWLFDLNGGSGGGGGGGGSSTTTLTTIKTIKTNEALIDELKKVLNNNIAECRNVVSGDIKDIVRVGLHKAHKLLVETNKLEEFERLVSGTWSNPKDQIIIMVVLNHHYTDVTLLFESLYTLMKHHTKVIEAPLVAKMDLIGSRTKLKDATMNSCAVFHPYMLNIHHEINKWFAMFHNCIVTRSMEIVNLGDDEIKLTKVIKTYVDLLEEIHQSVSQVIENDMPKALEKIEKALEKIDYGEVSEKYVPGFKLITDISKNSESFITDIKKHAALFENDTHKPNAKIKQRILEATRIQHKTAQLFAQWLGKIRRGVHITYTVSKAHCAMAKAMDAEIRHITRYFTNVIGKDK